MRMQEKFFIKIINQLGARSEWHSGLYQSPLCKMSITTGSDDKGGAEQDPVSPYSRCVGVYEFKGEGTTDLSFNEGDELTIIEPCSAMYWYLAEDSVGRRGVIPINYVEVVPRSKISLDPPPPPRPLKREPVHTKPPPAGAVSILPSPPPPMLASPISPPSPPQTRPLNVPPPRPVKSSQLSTQQTPLTATQPVADSPPPLPPPNPKSSTLSRKPVATPPSPVSNPSLEKRSSIDDRPPLPLPNSSPILPRPVSAKPSPPTESKSVARPLQRSKYPTIHDFLRGSGWFKPTVESVLSKKMSLSLQGFRRLRYGVYFFQHKYDDHLQYVGKSLSLSDDLTRLFSCLYDKPDEKMNALELVLKYSCPDAIHWNVRSWGAQLAENIYFEQTKLIMEHRTLRPSGLNEELTFVSRAHFNSFCEWYTEHRMKIKSKK